MMGLGFRNLAWIEIKILNWETGISPCFLICTNICFLIDSYWDKLAGLHIAPYSTLSVILNIASDWRTREWRKLCNEELSDPYVSPNIVQVIKWRRMRWAGHVACMGERRGVYRDLVAKLEGKRPLGRPRCRWEDNTKMDLQEVEREGMDWIELAQARDRWRALVKAVVNLRVP